MAEGGKAQPVVADVTDPAGVASLVATTGPVDVLVNNAGVPPGFGLPAPFVATTPEDWRPWMALNVDAVMRLCHGYRSEEHTSELQSLMRISYAVFCLKQKQQDRQ